MTSGSFTITKATTNDVNTLSELASSTFRETYEQFNTPENMHQYIREHFDVDILLKELINSNFNYLLAAYENEVAGYCMLDKSRTVPELDGADGLEISRIYVRNKFKGKKLGRFLIDACTLYAKENNYAALWLGVWQKNENAIAFYQHCGFEIKGITKFVLGEDVQDDFIMIKKLAD